MKHYASRKFWESYDKLPTVIRVRADKNFQLLQTNPTHSSLHFKAIGKYRSVRVGPRYRALGVEVEDGVLWFWIGSHAEYDKMLG